MKPRDLVRIAHPKKTLDRPGGVFDQVSALRVLAAKRWPSINLVSFVVCPDPAGARGGDLDLAAVDDPRIEVGFDLLEELWPGASWTMEGLLQAFHPLEYLKPGGAGCCCGHINPPEVDYLGIYVTIYHALGMVEGLVHETGHIRLKCLGIDVEGHDGKILANGPDELFESSIRKDKLRPMEACLHAFYSYLFVTEVDLRAFRRRHELVHVDPQEAGYLLDLNVGRTEEGLETIRAGAKWTDEGAAVWVVLEDWAEELIREGRRELGQ